MMCNLKPTGYYSIVKPDCEVYMCTRRGCRKHGFKVRGRVPVATCDAWFIGAGTSYKVFLWIFFFPVMLWIGTCNACRRRERGWNSKFYIPLPSIRWNTLPWRSPIYSSAIAKRDQEQMPLVPLS